jgi:hypothetical protein
VWPTPFIIIPHELFHNHLILVTREGVIWCFMLHDKSRRPLKLLSNTNLTVTRILWCKISKNEKYESFWQRGDKYVSWWSCWRWLFLSNIYILSSKMFIRSDLNIAVLHIHTINTFRSEKYSCILTLNIYLKWSTYVYKGI